MTAIAQPIDGPEATRELERELLACALALAAVSPSAAMLEPMLARFGTLLGADASAVHFFTDATRALVRVAHWTAAAIDPNSSSLLEALEAATPPVLEATLLSGREWVAHHEAAGGTTSGAGRHADEAEIAHHILSVPVVFEQTVVGCASFGWLRRPTPVPHAALEGSRQLASLLGPTLAKLRSARARDDQTSAARTSRDLSQLAVEGTEDGLWHWQEGAGAAWWSPRLYALLGYDDGEVGAGTAAFEAHVHREDLPRVRQAFARHLADGTRFDVDVRIRRRDASWFCARLRGRVVSRGPAGRCVAGSLRDVTEEKAAEEQSVLAERLALGGALAGSVSHDFNNLLTAIHNYARFAQKALPQHPARALDSLSGLLTASGRASSLTQKLLSFSSRQVIHRERTDLNALLMELADMLRRLVPESIFVDFILAQVLAPVSIDALQIEQALVNLCLNARDAMATGGTIHVGTTMLEVPDAPDVRARRYVALTVADTGAGMDRHTRDHAFEPFFTTKTRGLGTGLGLSIVYGIARQHGGFCRIESAEGKGTTVTLALPPCEAEQGAAEPMPKAVVRGGTERILVAEDNDLVRRIIIDVLTQAGYRVAAARNGAEAVDLFCRDPSGFDLVLLDAIMPNMSGREAYERICRARPGIRTLFCTGYAGGVFDETLVETPTRRLVPKPYDADVLLSIVRQVLDAE